MFAMIQLKTNALKYKNKDGSMVGIDAIGGKQIIDNELSTESINPVQNKVVTEAINQLSEELARFETHMDGVGPLVEIAETYFNVAYDEANQLAYHTGRGLFAPLTTDDDGVKSIVCSQFVQACIGGIDYLHSRYVKDANQRRPWGFVSDGNGEYSYDDADEIPNNDYMDAGNQARYFEGLGQLKEFRVNRNALKPGDLLFYKSANASDKYKSIGHVAICLGASEKRHTFMHATDEYKRKVDGKEAGVMVSTYNYSDYAPAYYVRSPISAKYTTELLAYKDINKSGEYTGASQYIDKLIFAEPLPRGFYTLEFDDEGDSLYGYIRAYYADGSDVIFDGNKNAGKNAVVFYAEMPLTQIDVRVATGTKYNCTRIELYKGFHGEAGSVTSDAKLEVRKADIERLSEEKVDKAQGTDNALKLLFVADNGNVSTVTAESGVEVQMRGDETDESIIVNLWKPDNYELGSFSNAGNKYAGDGTAMRSAEWIEVTPGAEYSAYFIKQPQLGMSLFFYDADGNFLEKKWAGGTLYHFTATGIKYVNFVVSSWYAKHPDDGVLPQMMLWRTTSTDLPTEYVEYGRYDKPRLLAPGVARNAADILAVRRSAFDGQFLNIAYSTIHKGIINSTEHFMTASKLGFNTLKCDVQPTSDGELVLCHDAGYTFDDNGRILQTMDEGNNTAIITMTAAEVAALEFAGAQDAQDYYSHPCFLEDFVRICKEKGKIAFITIRDDYIPDVVAPKLLEIVKKYNMVSRTIVNSFNIDSLRAVRNLNNEICLHQVGTRNQVLTKARVDQVDALGNAMLAIYMHPTTAGSTVLAESADAIKYAQKKGVRVLGANSQTYSEYNECIVNGLAGTQISSAILPYTRELLTFSVAVSGGVAAFTNTGAAERYTGEAVLSADEITVRNIKLQGSTRDFPDGILPIWMKYLPHRMEIISNSGQTCTVTYSNHAWHITAANIAADDTYKVYIEI